MINLEATAATAPPGTLVRWNRALRFAPPRHAPRGVLLGRHTTRYPSLVGLAMHAPERRQAQRNLGSTTLALSAYAAGSCPVKTQNAFNPTVVLGTPNQGTSVRQ